MDVFIERLKELREERNLSQEELAKAVDFSQSAMAAWEAGQRMPGALAIKALALYFNVTSDYLLGID